MGRFALIQNSSTSLTRVGSCTRGPLEAVLNMELYVNENNNAFYTHDFIQPSAKVTRPVPCRWQHSFLWAALKEICLCLGVLARILYTRGVAFAQWKFSTKLTIFPLKNVHSPPPISLLIPSDQTDWHHLLVCLINCLHVPCEWKHLVNCSSVVNSESFFKCQIM